MSYYIPNKINRVYPYDRKTDVINKLIYNLYKKDILSDNSTLEGLYLVKSYSNCYTIVFELDGEYRNEGVLIWIIVSTVDKILEWWDITNKYNLDIEYVIRGRRVVAKNYFELMFHSYNNRFNRGHRNGEVDNFHPRFEKMCRWMYHNKYHEYSAAMNRRYDPYRYRDDPQAQGLARQIERFGELDHPGYGLLQQRGGIQQGYYDYSIMGEQRQQRIIIPLEEIEQIETSRIKKMLNKIKIKW